MALPLIPMLLAAGDPARGSTPSRSGSRAIMFLYASGVLDYRVVREATTLSRAGVAVTLIALRTPGLPDVEATSWGRIVRVGSRRSRASLEKLNPRRTPGRFFRMRQLRWLMRYALVYRHWRSDAITAALAVAAGETHVVFYGHDLTGLVPANGARARHGGGLFYDAHELYLESGSVPSLPRPVWRALFRLEARLIRQCGAVITVNTSIAHELATRYGVPAPSVVMNCPPLGLTPVEQHASPMRRRLGLTAHRIAVVHGELTRGKGLMETVAAVELLPDDCALVVLGQGALHDALVQRASALSRAGRFHLVPPVSQEELMAWLSGADAAVVAFAAGSLNQRYATPNRLFESLAAGVPVVVSDFPELRRVVDSDALGAYCNPASPSSIASAILELTDEPLSARTARRARCRESVIRTYNWENQASVLVDSFRHTEVMSTPPMTRRSAGGF